MTSRRDTRHDGGGDDASDRDQFGGRDRGALHQPPNPDGLMRRPPGGPECAWVRGLLRDYVDGDLTAEQGRAVEEHAHICRVCAVELARAEHEVLRLRRAFLPLQAIEAPVPDGFAQRVVDRLVLGDESLMAARIEGGGSSSAAVAGGGPGAAVGDVRRPARLLERDGLIGSPAGMLVAALFFLFVFGVGVRLFASGDQAPTSIARLVVIEADGTYDGRRKPLGAGDWIGDLQSLWVARGGAVRADWLDPSPRTQPAATIEMAGGELRLEGGELRMEDGRVLIGTNRAVDLTMADGSRIGLGLGEYVIAAEIPSDMLDEPWEREDEPGLLAGALRIEVEVRSGDPARIVRAGGGVTRVTSGFVGVYQGSSFVDVSPVGPVAGIGAGDHRKAAPGDDQAMLSGHVLSPGDLPSVGARVGLSFASQGGMRTGLDFTASDGSFTVPTDFSCESDFAVVVAWPSAQRPDIGLAAPHALPVTRQGPLASLSVPVRFQHAEPLVGVVRDQLQQLRIGVQVVPCIVDELFGTVLVLDGKQRYTDAMGSFRITQLPARLPPHQTLVLLLADVGLEPLVVPVPERGSAVATAEFGAMVARQLRTIEVRGLPLNSNLTFFEEIPGLPSGMAAAVRTASSNGQGRIAAMQAGFGELWVRVSGGSSPNANLLKRLKLQNAAGVVSNGELPLYRPVEPSVAFTSVFRSLHALNDSDLMLFTSWRHEHFPVTPIVGAVEMQAVRVVDGLNRLVAGAEVFAIEHPGADWVTAEFLGFTSLQGTLPIGEPSPGRDLFVLGPAGEVAWATNLVEEALTFTVQLQATGRVNLAPSRRPAPSAPDRVVTLRFVRDPDQVLPGMKPVAVRFASDANDWEVSDLPPGRYLAEVGGVSQWIEVPPQGFVVIE